MNKDHSMRKNLNVWSDILKEENLCETLNKIDFVKHLEENETKIVNPRGVESYEYVNENLNEFFEHDNHSSASKSSKKRLQKKTKYFRNRPDYMPNRVSSNNSNKSNQIHLDKCVNNQMVMQKEVKEIKERLGPVIFFDESKRRDHIHVSELDSDEMVVKEIAKQLREPKVEIISRCVKVLGKKKSLELLYATEDIQKNGGIPTLEGDRKRTPGGVFLNLIKRDESILECQRSQIILKEITPEKKKRKNFIKRLKQKNKWNQPKNCLKEGASISQSTDKLDENDDGENETEDKNDSFENIQEEDMIFFEN